MSLPMKELRFGANEIAHILLDKQAHAQGIDKAELARRIINEWAVRMAHAHTMAEEEFALKRIKLDRAAIQSMLTGTVTGGLD